MQQAISTSSQISLPITLNRNLINQRFSTLFRTFNDYLYELNILDKLELKNSKLIKLRNKLCSQIESLENAAKLNLNPNLVLPIESILVDLISQCKQAKLDDNKQFVAHTLIEPILNQDKYKLSSTFFENRYGFSEQDLLKSQYKETKKSSLFKKNNTSYVNYQQVRGFRTKNQQKIENDDGNIFKNIFTTMRSNQQDQKGISEIEKVLSSINKNSKSSSKSIGSIFGDNKSASTTSGNKSFNELDDKIKVAFAEGMMYKQLRDEKRKLPTPVRVLAFLLFVLFIFLLTSSISISVPNGGNGKNGGGINIRAFTGNVNYEVNPETVHVKFDDVKGLPEAKKELTEIVDFLKDPEKYSRLGARLPKGVLLVGPPGCGKTLLAKSVAGEAGVPFFQASGSDFDEMFVGTGSKRVRQLFAAARARAPCVIFIDEIDSVGSTRTNSMIHPHANQTINQLLAEMDGFQKNEGVIVLGATNRRETLDSALMRPGRFDLEVRIDKPDLKARIEMLDYYLDKVAKDKDVDVKYLARQLTGLGGSSIENVVNQAALRAVVQNSNTVKMEHLEWALDRALMGSGKSRLTDEECNRNTAYHEAGHVLVAYFTRDSDSLHKVTILPRGSIFSLN
jgi:ATP-dependent metalloprotease FtsH